MIAFVDWLLALAGVPVLAAAVYLFGLTLLSRRQAPALHRRAPRLRFCIVVPAHDEEQGIGATVASLRAIRYPRDLFDVVVVADNCRDATAAVAAAHGARVLVRDDDERRGKGWALQFAIDRLQAAEHAPRGWDVLVVVDADTSVSADLLDVVSAHVIDGARAVQVAYMPRPGHDGPMAVVTEVALAAFHLVRSSARERLGLSCGLRGNGMAFRRDLLAGIPHAAFSRTEDLEFGVLLGLHGVRVAFAGQAMVRGDMPERRDVVARQRERWIGGRTAMARRFAWPLVKDAVTRRSLLSADLACDLVVPPLSVLLVAAAAGLGMAIAVAAVSGAWPLAATIWLLAAACLAVHVLVAARAAGRLGAFLRASTVIPGYALGRTLTAVKALRPAEEVWVRTLRKGETL